MDGLPIVYEFNLIDQIEEATGGADELDEVILRLAEKNALIATGSGRKFQLAYLFKDFFAEEDPGIAESVGAILPNDSAPIPWFHD